MKNRFFKNRCILCQGKIKEKDSAIFYFKYRNEKDVGENLPSALADNALSEAFSARKVHKDCLEYLKTGWMEMEKECGQPLTKSQ